MPGTPGPRTGLATINPTGEAPSLLRTTANAIITWLEGNAMLTSAGPLGSRPVSTPASPGISGRRYYATDTGVEYRDTGTGWVALGIELVTSLPASPYNGQIVDYLADATNGIVWRLRYRAASSSAYKWEAVGNASPLHSYISASEGTTANAYVNLATVGPDVTVPLAGDYMVSSEADLNPTTLNLRARVGLSIGGAAPSADEFACLSANGDIEASGTKERKLTGLAASTLLRLQYGVNTGGGVNALFSRRGLTVRPIRVG